MRRLVAPLDPAREAHFRASGVRREPATDEHYLTLIDEPTALFATRDATSPYAAYYPLADTELADRLYETLRRAPYNERRRTNGMKARAITFGNAPRTPLMGAEGCRPAMFNTNFPEVYADLLALGRDLAAEGDAIWPEKMAAQRAAVAAVSPEWRMTPEFTSGILNLNNALGYHRDGGNYRGSINWMITLRKDATGGHLVVPAADVAFACGHGYVAAFDAQATSHGVTAIRRTRTTGARISAVFYALKRMEKCLCLDDEIQRAKRKRTERERRRAGIIE